VVVRVRRALGIRAVGHTGTLDPFATGLLVVLIGRATRLARFVEAQAKTYLATVRLGQRTTTDDPTGQPVGAAQDVGRVGRAEIEAALLEFVGIHQQRPPDFSARHVGGERAYARARRGEAVELPASEVTVFDLALVAMEPARATFRVTVSAGTYVRALARDLGDRLGVGAHLEALRRESVGALRVEDAVPLDAIGPGTRVWPAGTVLSHLPMVTVSDPGREAVVHGRPVPGTEVGTAALLHDGVVIAVAEGDGAWLSPKVVLEAP
jgi:tRNA pseudouridine55 synthase